MRVGAREGIALLLALVTIVVVGLCVLALWQTRAGALRSDRLRNAANSAASDADSALAAAVGGVLSGGWRALQFPSALQVTLVPIGGRVATASVVRLGWGTLLLRGAARARGGLHSVEAFADDRLLVPLVAPFAVPEAALTGGRQWLLDPAATVGFLLGPHSQGTAVETPDRHARHRRTTAGRRTPSRVSHALRYSESRGYRVPPKLTPLYVRPLGAA